MSARAVVPACAALVLLVLHALAYWHDPARPGGPGVGVGVGVTWWEWYDQSKFAASAQALAQGNLDPWRHLYPLGYPLLAAPLLLWAPLDAAFAVLDGAALIVAFAGFVAAGKRLGVPAGWGTVLFVLPLAATPEFLRQWVIPWNTTPVAAFAWCLFACTAAWLDGVRRPIGAGALAAAIVVCRPSEVVIVLPCLIAIAWAELRERRVGGLIRLGAAGLLIVGTVAALHLAIYGPRGTGYLRSSAQIGFTLHDFGWKCYVILVDPYRWFADGEGLIQRAPWIALALPGTAAAALSGPKGRVLSLMLLLHAGLYVSYVDLLPGGLWRFANVHYWAWAIPGYALVGGLLVRDLLFRPAAQQHPRRRAAAAAVACLLAAVPVLCLRIEPNEVGPGENAKAVDFAAPAPPYLETYLAELSAQDGLGIQQNISEVRAVPTLGGVRLFGLKRDFVGPVAWAAGRAPPGLEGIVATRRWNTSLRFRWPAWLRRAPAPTMPILSGAKAPDLGGASTRPAE